MRLQKTNTRLSLLIVLANVWLPVGIHAETVSEPTLDERLRRLETELGALKAENAELRKELGLEGRDGRVVVKPAGRETTLAIGGLLQVQADALDKGDSRFTSENDRVYLRRARINAAGTFLEEFDFRIELEMAGSLGESSSMRAQLTDAYINWSRHDFANVRVGQFKSPYGFEQLASDPKLFTIERSLANDRLTLGRQIGVQAGGDGLDKRLSYATGVFNGTGANTSANDNDDFLWAGRVAGVPLQSEIAGHRVRWDAGLNGFTSKDRGLTGQPAEFRFDSTPATPAPDNVFAEQKTGVGADTQVKLGGLDLWAEYLRTHYEQSSGRAFDADGWYVQGAYFVVPKRVQAVLKFDSFDPDQELAGNSTDTWTFGLNYLIKGDDLKIQFNYLLSDIPGNTEQQDKLMLRLQAIF